MFKILLNPAQVITVDTGGDNFKRGKSLREINILFEHSIVVENNLIKDLITNREAIKLINKSNRIIDLKDKIVLPGLIECHTHSAYTGSRANEFGERLRGKTYEEIASEGGGINTTVKSVRKSSFEEIYETALKIVNHFISQGVTTLEIKSGYGLDYQNEIKLLKVINHLKNNCPINIIPTFLGAHTYPAEHKSRHNDYIEEIVIRMLPYISQNKLADFCDAFCESTAFSAAEIDKIFSHASELNLKLRLHSEQFNNVGGLDTALKHNAISIDHLEALKEDQFVKLKDKEIVCVLLPGVSFFLNYQFAPARKLIDNDNIIALSTDYNPGTCPIPSLHFIMSLAVLKMNMTVEETIPAVTINAAKALNLDKQIGSIEIGKKADFAVFAAKDYTEILYNINMNLNCMTIKGGKIIYRNKNFTL